MATLIMDPLPGLRNENDRQALWEGLLVQTSASQIETRAQQQSFTKFSWELGFNYLNLVSKGTYTDAIAAQNLQYLVGFYGKLAGGLLSFFYRDQEDNSATGAFIATGDGVTTAFQLQRDWGGYEQPVYGVDTRGAITYGGSYVQPAAIARQAYVNGSPVSATFGAETGILTLASASGTSGQPITADFSYLWRVRFMENSLDFKRMWNVVYGLDSLKIIQVLT